MKNKLPLGKIPMKPLLESVIRNVIYDSSSVLLPPAFGEDGAVIKSADNILIVASDPITGASERAGWLSVHVNANDIAVHAAYPKWYLVILLLPKESSQRDIDNVMQGIKQALMEINASLIGGHTETTDRVTETIIAGTMIGEPMIPGKYVTSSGAKPGDVIILTKGVGIEGTFILATDFADILEEKGVSKRTLEHARLFEKYISILPDVVGLIKGVGIENVHAMHDITEGGLLGGVYEMAYASGLGFKIYEESIPIFPETKEVCSILSLDPLKLISSGSLLAAVDRTVAEEAAYCLRKKGVPAAVIGEFTQEKKGFIIRVNGSVDEIREPPVDELWRLIKSI